ncbi:AEC family transporter [Schnuerera ultunensis]|uniref:Putative Auxin efflux carrier family protein n=1 Tax=[Clostridium] ultunense Esp TaxID=1288971 RepID=A0A1M4PPX1_9FIRM|nr:AEC family transporter [Schnuerera ultunensis]SHD77529.1 putative Auxin efflux carrier family protein [[Clostridium] ultunense Esp]
MFLKSLESTFILIILIFAGWIMSRIGWINDDVKSFLSKVTVKVGIPALTITNFFENFSNEMLISSFKFVGIALLSMAILIIISKIISKIMKIEPIKSGSFVSMSSVSNSMFFGLPICLSLFGEISIPYIIFYYVANTVMFWSVLSPMIAKDGNNKVGNILQKLKNIFNIPLITVIVSGILLYFNFKPPSIVLKSTKYFSGLVTPLASMVVGKIIYDMDLSKYKLDKSVFAVVFMRFIISPSIMYIITRFFNLPVLATQVFIIQSAMPVMMQITIVSELYNTDSKYVAATLSITTLLSLLTIPFYMLIMDKIFI